MSPFRVDESGEGYVATNSISGTRLQTSIKELPMPIEVVTEQFLIDTGAEDIREGLAFSSGVVMDEDFNASLNAGGSANGRRSFDFSPSGSGSGVSETQFKIRGFNTNVQLRQGYNTPGILDSADISRAEVVRGPAALLYGHSILGGVVNVIPKYPLNVERYRVGFSVGSNNNYRTTFDATGPLMKLGVDTLNYRITGAWQTWDNWIDDDEQTKFFIAPKLEFRPWNGGRVYIDTSYFEGTRKGNGPEDVVSSVRNQYNERTSIARDIGKMPESFRWSGDDQRIDTTDMVGLFEFQQDVGDWLTFVASYQYQKRDEDRLLIRDVGIRANDGSTPESVRRPRLDGGNGYEAIRFRWEDTPQEIEWNSYRLEAVARWDRIELPFLGYTDHSLVLGHQSTEQEIFRTDGNRSPFQWHARDDYTPFQIDQAGWTPTFFRDFRDERPQDGTYAVYQGKFWEDKIQLVGGVRYDEYIVRTRQYLYQADGLPRAEPRGSLPTDSSGDQRQWNTGPWAVEQGLPGARGSDAPVREGYRFGGEWQTETSPTLGVTWNINDSLSVYGLSAAGLVPNPGQRNGFGENFEAEQTQSLEAGIKFDLVKNSDGHRILSGTASVFSIERENAIWFYSFASSPRNNKGVQRSDDPERGGFDPRLPRSFAVDSRVWEVLGNAGYVPDRPPTHPGQLTDPNFSTGGHPTSNDGQSWMVVNYETLGSVDPIERAAIEAMLNGFTATDGTFIQTDFLGGPGSNRANWTGNSRGSDVSFNDESTGVDAQLVFSPKPNWQITFNYAYVKREVTEGFALVDFVDPLSGINYGTEYDLWITRFGGPSNFTDPTRASTGNGDILIGQSLDDSPEHSGSMWSNYTIQEGPLKDLSIRFGAIYTGERQSSVEIGDGSLRLNTYPTPFFSDNLDIRGGLGYRIRGEKYNWNFNFNVYNMFDEVGDEVIIEFQDPNAGTLERRSRTRYAPRSFRFSASVDW